MTERKKDFFVLTALLVLLILFYSTILFTGKIIRAPDIINEFYWGVVSTRQNPFSDVFNFSNIKADWNIYINGGVTSEGGIAPIHFLFYLKLLFLLVPSPASIAWCIVLHLFFGSCGLYLYCRAIGLSRPAAFLGGIIFAIAPEQASLINAGHVMKIATITFAPWVFYFFERGLQSRRTIFFLATGLTLALQFFNTHWQIAFYTCLAVGAYGLIRFLWVVIAERKNASGMEIGRLFCLNLLVLVFFLSCVSIALFPLANWSKDTNRGVNSGANQGKGGLDREEAMSWSLPPEEVAALVIPGFFGYSRQEAGENPPNIDSYYWGRMVFTQTISYMGLLPWLLVPLPLLFRRDKYTWLAVIGITGGLLFSMGKYTPFYHLLYDYFPGINRFRVPKMIMFIPVIGLGILSARGIDLLMDPDIRGHRFFRRYLAGVVALPLALLLLLWGLQLGKATWIQMFIERLAQPTRYEQGTQLIIQRWNNLIRETVVAEALAALYAATIVFWSRKKSCTWLLPIVLIALYIGDVWRVNNKFMFLVNAPEQGRSSQTAVTNYLARDSNQFRTLPMDGSDPMHYVSNKIPVMFTSNAVQQQRWQEYLDNFSINSAMPDLLNVKYLVFSNQQYAKEQSQLSNKFVPVFQSPDGPQLVLENRAVLPKAWLVPAVLKVDNPAEILSMLQSAIFNPLQTALVESPAPITLDQPFAGPPGNVRVEQYQGERIILSATTKANSLLVLGDKYYKGWKATIDGRPTAIYPVNYILRGVYLTPGTHTIEFVFDPLPFKIGKWLTLSSFAIFVGMLIREIRFWRRKAREGYAGDGQIDRT